MFSPSGFGLPRIIIQNYPGEHDSYTQRSRERLEREYDEFLAKKREKKKMKEEKEKTINGNI